MKKYCVYLTTYLGSRLPMFYIGSKDIDSVTHGYRGSVASREYSQIFKEELENHPELFKSRILSYHSTREEAYMKEQKLQLALNVLHNPLYFNRAIAGKALGLSNRGRTFTKEHVEKLVKARKEFWKSKNSASTKGKRLPNWTNERRKKFRDSMIRAKMNGSSPPMLGKKHSEETRAKMRASAILREQRKRAMLAAVQHSKD
jgi:hypothetical protein